MTLSLLILNRWRRQRKDRSSVDHQKGPSNPKVRKQLTLVTRRRLPFGRQNRFRQNRLTSPPPFRSCHRRKINKLSEPHGARITKPRTGSGRYPLPRQMKNLKALSQVRRQPRLSLAQLGRQGIQIHTTWTAWCSAASGVSFNTSNDKIAYIIS